MANLYEATEELDFIRDMVLLEVVVDPDDKATLHDKLAPHVESATTAKTQLGDTVSATPKKSTNNS